MRGGARAWSAVKAGMAAGLHGLGEGLQSSFKPWPVGTPGPCPKDEWVHGLDEEKDEDEDDGDEGEGDEGDGPYDPPELAPALPR